MIVDRLLKIALFGSSWVLYFLLVLSVISFAAMLERWLFFRRFRVDADALRSELQSALLSDDLPRAERALKATPSVEGRVLLAALRWRAGGAAAVTDAVDSELGHARKELEKGMNLLGTLGNNAPFIGLFGTVLGVIEAFHQLSGGAGKAAMGNVMSGIAEALVATGVGLFVALPAVVAYNIAQKRIGEIEGNTIALSKLFTAYITTKSKGGLPIGNESEEDAEQAPEAEVARALSEPPLELEGAGE